MENNEETYNWYTIQAYGNELKIVENINNILEINGLKDLVKEIVVPTVDVIEMKKGEKVIKEMAVYSGYIFINADLTTELQNVITSIPKVSKFVTDGIKPVKISESDIDNILKRNDNRGEAKPRYNYEKNEKVLILEGAFANFKGTVEDYDMETGILTLEVMIFGRKTPVEINFENVEKIEE